jgi:hypothetical protein
MANRDIPPLQYARVYQLISDFPHIEFEINGAISSPEAVHLQLSGNKGLKGESDISRELSCSIANFTSSHRFILFIIAIILFSSRDPYTMIC